MSLSNPPTLDFAGHSFADFGYLTIGPIHNFYLRGFGTTANQGFASIGTSHDRGIAVVAAGGYSAAKLPFGALIGGAGRVFSQYACNLAKMNGSSTAGQFLSPDGTGYIGFKQGVYYGWLKVAVSFNGDGVPVSLSLVPKADTDIYGAFGLLSDGVRAGETTAVPEPSAVGLGLGLFALGAVGVREMRRRRAAAAA
ncbi:MAG TPA: hypothetical protein VG710_13250 [Opitutus sp.]|nr:hypothetical protein [Opitutus sp.]